MFTYDQIGLSVILTNTHSRKQLCVDLHEFFTARRVCIARTMPWQDVCRPSVRLFDCPSVCPSVCHTPVLSLNGYTYPQSFFTIG